MRRYSWIQPTNTVECTASCFAWKASNDGLSNWFLCVCFVGIAVSLVCLWVLLLYFSFTNWCYCLMTGCLTVVPPQPHWGAGHLELAGGAHVHRRCLQQRWAVVAGEYADLGAQEEQTKAVIQQCKCSGLLGKFGIDIKILEFTFKILEGIYWIVENTVNWKDHEMAHKN